ncbi:protein kinase [Streptomyces sp. NBC_00178]|uniref:protein kinase domain-containing protein n=1 Tax=Streptomyces sp. NBC_00178 TaxID=2975672 RepID=UPI002E291950|nr:protein kinase [Streptomyces sp. NBC_00178]
MEKLGPGDPQRIGTYRLLRRLGSGGMGQVFLARSDRGRTVAIKLVRPELAAQQQFRDRFRAEVQAARRVGGAWTAPVLDAGVDAAVPWLATGYVAGPSLHRIVSGRPGTAVSDSGAYGPLPERSVRALGAGLACALQDIHTAGLIHRDLKPSNVLMTIDGPRVIDFGIARALETTAEGGLTRTGSMIGSPGFMAPEQVRGERLTTACDVFCLGSVLAYAATGRLPFGSPDDGAHALMFRIAQEDPDLAGVPDDLLGLIRECLAKDPSGRPTTDAVLERMGDTDTAEPWLPGALIAQLGRHAVGLLDSEDPEEDPAEDPAGDVVPGEGEVPPLTGGAPGGPAPAGRAADGPAASGAAGTGPDAAGGVGGVGGVGEVGAGSVPLVVAPVSTPAGRPPTAPESAGPSPEPVAGPPRPTPAPGPGTHPDTRPPGGARGLPTLVGPDQRPAAPPPGPSYGYPPRPVQGHGYGGPHPPYATPPAPFSPVVPGRRRGAGPALTLGVVAVLVAAGVGWGVYTFMRGDGDAAASPTGAVSPSGSAAGSGGASSSGSSADGKGPNADGTIPSGYLGTWTGTIGGGADSSTRRLVIRQGGAGDTVLSLTAEGPLDGGGSYHCVFQAELESDPAPGSPVRIGPSEVTSGRPVSSCTPGRPTVLTLLPDGSLRREITDTGESLTYTKAG